MEQVEGEERHGPSLATAQSASKLRSVGAAGRIDHDQLAIEDGRPRSDADRQPGELRQGRGQVASLGVADDDRARPGELGRPDRHERPLAAPPRLEQVIVRIEWRRQRTREHRPEVRELGQLVGFEAQRKLVGHRRSMVAR